jgi:guanylate cyclase
MQFREMINAGLHHLQDPKQLIFLENQNNVVKAVLNKEVDVGFVRTDQLERFIDPESEELLDLSRVKIIGRQDGLTTSDGLPFPFPASTELYPEWALASFPWVGEAIEREVQTSLMELTEHASTAASLLECYGEKNCTSTECEMACFSTVNALDTCGVTKDTVLLADMAKTNGKFSGWRPPLSYMTIQNMQEDIGFIQNEGGKFHCIRGKQLQDKVVCPEGHFKKHNEDIQNGCETIGLPCYGFNCMCKPCVKSYDVDFYPIALLEEGHYSNVQTGCSKFEVCGAVQQNHKIKFRAVDNRQRQNASFVARIRVGDEVEEYPFVQVAADVMKNTSHFFGGEEVFMHEFEFDASQQRTGYLIMEVVVNGEQIPESPFRLEVLPRDCRADTGDSLREPDVIGDCICENTAVAIGPTCTPLTVVIPSIIIPIVVLIAVIAIFYAAHKRRKADLLWKIHPKEMSFDTPPQVLGRGRFGEVYLAKYRGTEVAVKRVLTPEDAPRDCAPLAYPITTKGGQFIPLSGATQKKLHECHPEDMGDELSESDIDVEIGLKSGFYLPPDQGKNVSLTGTNSSMRGSSRFRFVKSHFAKEMRLLSQMRHPCITTVMGAVTMENSGTMLVLEYMELGSLRDVLHSGTMVVDDTKVLAMVQDVAKGIRFLHNADPKIVHGDIKAANILVDSNFRAKVSDFGLSQRKYTSTPSGTPYFMVNWNTRLVCVLSTTPSLTLHSTPNLILN